MTEVPGSHEIRSWEAPLRQIKDVVDRHLGPDFDSGVSLAKGAADISRRPFDKHHDFFTEYGVSLRSQPHTHEWTDDSTGESRASSTLSLVEFTYKRATDEVGIGRLEVIPEGWKVGKSPKDGHEAGLLTLIHEGLEQELDH